MSTGGSGNYRETELMTPYLRNSQGSEKREVLAAVTNIIGVIVFSYFYYFFCFGLVFVSHVYVVCMFAHVWVHVCGCRCTCV